MREKMMNKDYAKAFKTIVIMAVLLALLSAVVIPLSLSQQISDASHFRQQAQAADMTEHQAERALKSRTASTASITLTARSCGKAKSHRPRQGRWRPSAASRSSGWRLEFITGCWSPRGFIRAR